MSEIAPCPMPGCGKPCRVVLNWLTCVGDDCGYSLARNCYDSDELMVAAHNALCADVTLAKNLRTVAQFGVHIAHEVGGGRERWLLSTRSGTDTGSTLDAALAELVKKIGGSDEG